MVNNRRMESRIEGCDARIDQAEQHMGQLEADMGTMKVDMETMKSMLKEVMTELRVVYNSVISQGKETQEEGRGSHSHHRESQETRQESRTETSKTTRQESRTETSKMDRANDFFQLRKLDMPIFSGEDPLGWVFRMERYFKIGKIDDKERLDAAILGLENRALNWFQWREVRAPILSWEEFKQELLARFHSAQDGSSYEMIMALKQLESVAEYIEKFEQLSSSIGTCEEEMLRAAFLNGLKLEIKADLRLMKLTTLAELMDMSLKLEERDLIKTQMWGSTRNGLSKDWVESYESSYKTHYFSNPTRVCNNSEYAKSANPSTLKSSTVIPTSETKKSEDDIKTVASSSFTNRSVPRKFTDAEIERRRELGLCFKCDEKYYPGHRCKKKQLQVLILSEELDEKGVVDVEPEEGAVDRPQAEKESGSYQATFPP